MKTARLFSAAIILAGTMTIVFAQVAPRAASGPSAAATATQPAAPTAATGVEVKIVSIEENRAKSLAPDSMIQMSSLRVSLAVTGEPAAKTARFGKLQIEKATDDKGTDLTEKEHTFSRDLFEGFRSAEDQFGPKVKNGFGFDLNLKPAKRDAAKIAQIKGSVVILTGGKKAEATIADAASQVGKEPSDAALQAAGVKIKIESAKDKTISYTMSGNTDAVLEVSLVDAAGKKVDAGRSSWSTKGQAPTYGLDVMGDMPAKAGLKVTLLTDAKAFTVPFDLKDIALP